MTLIEENVDFSLNNKVRIGIASFGPLCLDESSE